MDHAKLLALLKKVKTGKTSLAAALSRLKSLPYEDLGFAKLDHHRTLRRGFPEVIYCQGKTIPQILSIVKSMSANHHNVLATRADKKVFRAVKKAVKDARFHEPARLITVERKPAKKNPIKIAVVTGGTADLPVAEEAAVTAEFLGNRVTRLYDVGVAGIHRLLGNVDKLNDAAVIVVVAGMEGALASVVGGIVDKPIIAVPTSVGYGSNFEGLSALLTMLNSCAPGVAVVNIDNGFGAGVMASMINQR